MEIGKFFDGEKRIAKHYPDLEPDYIYDAKSYLSKIVSGELHSMNITREEAEGYIIEIDEGTMPESNVKAHAYNERDNNPDSEVK